MSELVDHYVEEIPWPSEFRDQLYEVWLESPQAVVQAAAEAAAYRERAGEVLAESRRILEVQRAALVALRDAGDDALDEARVSAAQRSVSRGWGWEERASEARIQVLDLLVDVRKQAAAVERLRSSVEWLEAVHRAWRDTEWALDRQVRLLQLRHALGEV